MTFPLSRHLLLRTICLLVRPHARAGGRTHGRAPNPMRAPIQTRIDSDVSRPPAWRRTNARMRHTHARPRTRHTHARPRTRTRTRTRTGMQHARTCAHTHTYVWLMRCSHAHAHTAAHAARPAPFSLHCLHTAPPTLVPALSARPEPARLEARAPLRPSGPISPRSSSPFLAARRADTARLPPRLLPSLRSGTGTGRPETSEWPGYPAGPPRSGQRPGQGPAGPARQLARPVGRSTPGQVRPGSARPGPPRYGPTRPGSAHHIYYARTAGTRRDAEAPLEHRSRAGPAAWRCAGEICIRGSRYAGGGGGDGGGLKLLEAADADGGGWAHWAGCGGY